MDISFDALFLNERPELNKYADGLLGDLSYYIDHEILDYQFGKFLSVDIPIDLQT